MARKHKRNARRANGEGSIIQRKDGRWAGVILLGYKPDGKPNRKTVYGHSQAEVLQKLSELKHKLVTGSIISNKALLGPTMKEWLRIYKKTLVSSRTFEQNIRTFRNHIEPALGDRTIDSIKSNDIQMLLTKSLEDHNGFSNTPKRIKFLLNQFFEYLIEQGLAYDNPTMRCKISNKMKKTFIDKKGNLVGKENYKAIPVSERARFIKSLDYGPDIIKPLSLVMMFGSLRVGEALGLKWENVDFDREAIYVEQGLTEDVEFDDDLNIIGRKDIISTTKTSCSRRAIKMPKLLVDALKQWKKVQWCKEQVKGVHLTKPSSLVFCNDDGSIKSYDGIRRMFDRFTKKFGFKQEFGIHCHMLRQTFSNMQIENKRNIKDVQHLMGHKDAKTTQLHYNSVIDKELDDEGAKIIDNLFNEETLKKDDENYKPKDVPAYHIDEENYSNEILNPKAKSEEELEIEMLQKMLEEKQAKLKAKKNRDFEM